MELSLCESELVICRVVVHNEVNGCEEHGSCTARPGDARASYTTWDNERASCAARGDARARLGLGK